MTLPEVLLWQRLRGQPQGLKFRRQHPSGRVAMDFYCSDARLVVEIDGMVHDLDDRPERDARRDAWLASKGIDTVRLAATEVLRDPDAAAEGIVETARSRLLRINAPPSALRAATSPSRARGGTGIDL